MFFMRFFCMYVNAAADEIHSAPLLFCCLVFMLWKFSVQEMKLQKERIVTFRDKQLASKVYLPSKRRMSFSALFS